jgi:hypothetical protein
VVACTDDFNTPVSADSRLEDFRGGDFNRASISSNFFPERTSQVCCRFLFNNNEPGILSLINI